MHGIGTLVKKKGSIFKGKFDQDKLINGKATFYSGITYEGMFNDQFLPDGEGVLIHPDQYKYVGQFKDGKMHGQGIWTGVNGEVKKGQWE